MPQASVLKRGQVQVFLVKMIFYYHAKKTHFHKKGFAPDLVLKVGVFETRKWPILFSLKSENFTQTTNQNDVIDLHLA